MKAERRHELKTNTLATKIVQLPDVGRKWAGRAALGLAIVLAVAALVYNRVSNSRRAEADAADAVAQARAALDEIRGANPGGFKPFDAAYMNTIKEKRKQGIAALDEAASLSTDPKLRARDCFCAATSTSPYSVRHRFPDRARNRHCRWSQAANCY